MAIKSCMATLAVLALLVLGHMSSPTPKNFTNNTPQRDESTLKFFAGAGECGGRTRQAPHSRPTYSGQTDISNRQNSLGGDEKAHDLTGCTQEHVITDGDVRVDEPGGVKEGKCSDASIFTGNGNIANGCGKDVNEFESHAEWIIPGGDSPRQKAHVACWGPSWKACSSPSL